MLIQSNGPSLPLSHLKVRLRGGREDEPGDDEEGRLTEVCIRLHEAIKKLEPRLRTVIDMLLDGKSQAVIAHVLNICEGTVSRLRCRAIEELQRLTAEQGE